jgi:hypothetical protein
LGQSSAKDCAVKVIVDSNIYSYVDTVAVGKAEKGYDRRNTQVLAELIAMTMVSERLAIEFSRTAAILARERARAGLGPDSSIDWISAHCQLAKRDVADRLAIGESILKR